MGDQTRYWLVAHRPLQDILEQSTIVDVFHHHDHLEQLAHRLERLGKCLMSPSDHCVPAVCVKSQTSWK